MKSYKNQAIIFGVLMGIFLIVGIIVTYKYMQLRKKVAIVATKTPTPTASAIRAAVDAINEQANSMTPANG